MPPRGSVAVTVTPKVPLTLGVPVMTPVVGLMLRPVGKPMAVKVRGCPSGSEKDPAVVVLKATPIVADCGEGIPPPAITGA